MSEPGQVRPFRIEVPQEDVDDLRDRLARTRWPDMSLGDGWSRGIPQDRLQDLATYWATDYNWRAHEAALNAVPQFVTEIDGQRIHFGHLRSPNPDAIPLIITHGYPSSIVEFLDLIGPLTDPGSHGGDPNDAFHVVAPSLPGFGFSTPLADAGWHMVRTARAWAELMRRLGYRRYGAHGGDIGAGITGMLASVDPDVVIGTHITSDPLTLASIAGEYVPVDLSKLTGDERKRFEQLQEVAVEGKGYLQLQSTRPQSLAYGLADSPAFQLGWIAEPFRTWTEQTAQWPDGVDRDRLLTNISIYWFTRSGPSAAHVLYDNAHATEWLPPGNAPQAWAVFAADPIVRKLMDPDHAIAHWSEFERAGHFPALEVPDLLTADLRAFFRTVR